MINYTIVLTLICLLSCFSYANIPGSGVKVSALSDDFEDINWSFNYSSNISSNGMWYGSYRGAPEVLQRTTPPSGGVPGQTGALRIRSIDNDGDGYPQQDDFVSKFHNQLYGRYLQRTDLPSFVSHIYLPAYSSMQNQWSTLGFRIEARSSQLSSSYYYPSIWLQYYNNNAGVVVRMGDGQANDQYILNLGNQSYQGGWVTVGISFDAAGVGHYYFKRGVSAFTPQDKIYDTTMFPGGSNAKMDWIAYHFLSIGYSADNYMSPDYRIEDISVYYIPEPMSIFLLGIGSFFIRKKRNLALKQA